MIPEDLAPIAVKDVFARLGTELHALARLLSGVERALAELTSTSALMPKEASMVLVQDLQALDLILQSLDSLSQFSARLSEAMMSPVTVDVGPAASAITLSDLASRLTRQPMADVPAAQNGEIEYF
jgi:hypothetical protein